MAINTLDKQMMVHVYNRLPPSNIKKQITVIYCYKCCLIQFWGPDYRWVRPSWGSDPKSTSETTSLIRFSHSAYTFPNHPSTIRSIFIPQNLLKLLKVDILNLPTPLHPFLPVETIKKELAHSFLPFLCLVTNWCASL